jgi:hypothetical protein
MVDKSGYVPFECNNPQPSPSQAKWHQLYNIAPTLRRFHLDAWKNMPAPKALDREIFVALCACLCDPERREILRALLFDLLNDDIIELLTPRAGEGGE